MLLHRALYTAARQCLAGGGLSLTVKISVGIKLRLFMGCCTFGTCVVGVCLGASLTLVNRLNGCSMQRWSVSAHSVVAHKLQPVQPRASAASSSKAAAGSAAGLSRSLFDCPSTVRKLGWSNHTVCGHYKLSSALQGAIYPCAAYVVPAC